MMATLVRYGRLVRFSHTVFALPFALAALALSGAATDRAVARFALVLVCMVAARTCAMAVNRLVDRRLDAANPRTASRELVTGAVSVRGAASLALVCAAVFVVAASLLGTLPGILSLPVLAFLCGYSFAKRFTWVTHVWLGIALALAPLGASIAWRGDVPVPILVLASGVACWVAGFDILYSLADEAHDRSHGLRSIPARFGTRSALVWAGVLHVLALAAFAAAGIVGERGAGYFAGVALVAVFLAVQHGVPSLRHAVFKLNGAVGVVFLAGVVLDSLGAIR